VYRRHELSKRLGRVKVEELVHRARAGESVRSLARELDVASSALTRVLREEGVVISKRKVSDDETAAMAREYEAGATMAELEEKYGLSHGAVLRALHRCGAKMRASAPRHKN
jgi:transposase-like protein